MSNTNVNTDSDQKIMMSFIVSATGVLSLWFRRPGVPVKHFSVSTEHPHHTAIVEALKAQVKDYELIERLCSPATPASAAAEVFVQTLSRDFLIGKAEIVDGKILVAGKEVNNVITDRILAFAKMGLPIDPILRFLELMLQNPDPKSQEELYDFLANRNLPLTEDGHFLAYKAVRMNWMDHHSGTIDNSIGNIVEIPRDLVDPDRRNECSYGLHVGAMEYVRQFHSGSSRTLVVKVSPQDCVSVPRDHNHQKLRACRYEVLYEIEDELKSPCYDESGTTAQSGEIQNHDWTGGWGDENKYESEEEEDNSGNDEDFGEDSEECEEECEVCGENDYCNDPSSCEAEKQDAIAPNTKFHLPTMSDIVAVQPMAKQVEMFPMEIVYANSAKTELAVSVPVDHAKFAIEAMQNAGMNPSRFNFERHDDIAACAKELGIVKSREEGRKIPKNELLMMIGNTANSSRQNGIVIDGSAQIASVADSEVERIVEDLLSKDGFMKDQSGGSAFVNFMKEKVKETMKMIAGKIPAPPAIAQPVEEVVALTDAWKGSVEVEEEWDSSNCEWESSNC